MPNDKMLKLLWTGSLRHPHQQINEVILKKYQDFWSKEDKVSWGPNINGLPEVSFINAVYMSIERHISWNIFICCRTKTETAWLRFFMVGNFVPSNWKIPDTKAIEFAPKAQEIFPVIEFRRKLTMPHEGHLLSLEVSRQDNVVNLGYNNQYILLQVRDR